MCDEFSIHRAASRSLFPSPLWGGVRGGGGSSRAPRLPPSLSLPQQKGVHARLRRAMGGGNARASPVGASGLMLRIENLDVFHGDAQALDGVSLDIAEGAIVA